MRTRTRVCASSSTAAIDRASHFATASKRPHARNLDPGDRPAHRLSEPRGVRVVVGRRTSKDGGRRRDSAATLASERNDTVPSRGDADARDAVARPSTAPQLSARVDDRRTRWRYRRPQKSTAKRPGEMTSRPRRRKRGFRSTAPTMRPERVIRHEPGEQRASPSSKPNDHHPLSVRRAQDGPPRGPAITTRAAACNREEGAHAGRIGRWNSRRT